MCDIYSHKCKKCAMEIEMHLGDYNTGEDEIDVYCQKHIPKNVDKGVVWEYGDDKKKVKKIYIQSNTQNAAANWEGNHPNSFYLKALKIFGKDPWFEEKKTETIKVIKK